MALITPISIKQGPNASVAQELSLSDEFVYKQGGKQIMFLQNNTGSPVELIFQGNLAVSANFPGFGFPIDLSAGVAISLDDGDNTMIQLDSIRLYLDDSDKRPTITSDVAGVDIFLFEL